MVFSRKHDPKSFTVVAAEPAPHASGAPPLSLASPSHMLGESVIGKDMSIEGQSITVRCKGSLRVNGAIEADLHCVELVVGEQAVIKGSIAAEKVRVFGHVNGAILGANVVLHPSAQVEGDIHSQQLTIEQGATFDGRSRKVSDAAEVAPQLEAEPEPVAQARY
jgi:cytoskeletal protein CcmA (bactofilin family)